MEPGGEALSEVSQSNGPLIFIFDGRHEQAQTHRYHEREAALYEYCSDARTPKRHQRGFRLRVVG